MKGTTFKRCGCRDPRTGKRLGQSCPQLRRSGGGWSRSHGQWHLQIELPPAADGRRRPLRNGIYPSQTEAEADLDRIRAALAVPDPADTAALRRVGDLIAASVKAGEAIPTVDDVRRALHLDLTPRELPTVAEYLTRWLAGRKTIKAGTRRSYAGHIRLHLIPYLGQLRIDRLRPGHIDAMYDAIDERNATITRLRGSRDPNKRAQVKGQRVVGPATQHRIHATLRKALGDAVRRDKLRTDNPALMVELPPAKAPKATVWTGERVTAWKETGKIPSPVMVWTPQQTGAFLDHTHDANDRLYALYHLITFTGLRRGEACGLHWDDVDLDTATLTVRWQIVQHGWATALDTPKTDDSDAAVTLRRADRGRAARPPQPPTPRTAHRRTRLDRHRAGLHHAHRRAAAPRRRDRPLPPPGHTGRAAPDPAARPAPRHCHPRPGRRRPNESHLQTAAALQSHLHRQVLRRRPTRTHHRCRRGHCSTRATPPLRRRPISLTPLLRAAFTCPRTVQEHGRTLPMSSRDHRRRRCRRPVVGVGAGRQTRRPTTC